ncbi:MAG: hypothetical protein K1W06_02510 [Lachnospiraceae bacterium]
MYLTMADRNFLQYWLCAAFPHCYFLWNYLSEKFPDRYEWSRKLLHNNKEQEGTPAYKTVSITSPDGKEITILLYRYHAEYKIEGKELYQPYLSYHAIENLDNDTFFLLLPVVDVMIDYENIYKKMLQDLCQRLSETALPKEYVKETAYGIKIGLMDADGAEDEPSWIIWQETEESLYGAMWWKDARMITLFQKYSTSGKIVLNKYITVPEGENAYLWGKSALSRWISCC